MGGDFTPGGDITPLSLYGLSQRVTMSYDVIPCHTMLYHVIPCHTMLYQFIPCNTMSYHVIPCYTMALNIGHWTATHDDNNINSKEIDN